MFFTTTSPAGFARSLPANSARSLERLLAETQACKRQAGCVVAQDDTSFTLSVDVPGVNKAQLSIGIEAATVRIESREGAPRAYRFAVELPQDIDLSTSQATLADGVLTLKLGKLRPASRVSELEIH